MKTIRLIMKLPLMFIHYAFVGLIFTITICAITWFKFVKYFIIGVITPVVVFNRLFSKNKGMTDAERIKERNKKIAEENAKKLEQIRKKEAAEKAKIANNLQKQQELEKEIAKKKTEDGLSGIQKKTFAESLRAFFISLGAIPGEIAKGFKKSFSNSMLVKNKNNQDMMQKEALLIDFDGEAAKKSAKKKVYEYVAKNPEGKVVKDYFEAFSKVEVHSFLLSEGYEVYSITTSQMIYLMFKLKHTSSTKVKIKDLIFFLTQLSTYIKAGIPLVEALHILSRQFKKVNYQKLFKSLMYDLTMGDNFSDAMSKQGNAFPKILINMVKAAEMTGELPETLDDMAGYFTEVDKTKKQMITAMMYPTIVFVLAISAVTFIMVYIVPQFVVIYKEMDNSELPAITVAVMSISDFLSANLIILIISIIIIIILFAYLFKNVKLFRTFVQYILMKFPIISEIIIFNEVTMFTKTFASLLKHNVFITETMEILNKITNNEIWKAIILDTIANLAKGEKISLSFENHWAVPIPAYEMIVTGERTGQLPEMMQKVSEYYQELHKNAVGRIKAFIEPILILFLTAIVGLIVLSIVVPMFGMYNNLS